ncbi:MAG: TRM11 family SAM-dependent methyltransferase [Bradymonadia bacterium]
MSDERPPRSQRPNRGRGQGGGKGPRRQGGQGPGQSGPPKRRPAFKKPPLRIQTTTLWDYPSQHYGEGMQGDQRYIGATPSYVIWNLLQRYTEAGEIVVDPFCGSGTTLDVAKDLRRRGRGFDVNPFRGDIEEADARALPLDDETAHFVFMDPPYSDNIKYSDKPNCIGRIKATDEAYFEALDEVFAETHRVLHPGRHMAVYICDTHSKKDGFVPIGTRCLALLLQYFIPVDHIAVVRHNKTLKMGNYHRAAEEGNFFLRGFNHLIIMQKPPLTDAQPAGTGGGRSRGRRRG